MALSNVCIVSRYSYQFWCKKCKCISNKVYKMGEESYCDKCVPEDIKKNCVVMNQNREILKEKN